MLPQRLKHFVYDAGDPSEVFISHNQKRSQDLEDPELESHFRRIEDHLRPYNSVVKRLFNLDLNRISDVIGICEDPDGSRSPLNMQGSAADKINYVTGKLSNKVGVVLNMPQIADGLFEMGGFDFKSYHPENFYRLLKFEQNGTLRFCIVDQNNMILCWLENPKPIHYLQLLEQSIQTNPEFQDSLRQCIAGEATPLKLFFNHRHQIEYSAVHPPETYKQVFQTYPMETSWKNMVMNSLQNLQLGISFNTLQRSESGQEKLCTHITVMHDIQALESIKDIVPQVYAEIKKRAYPSEAGRFYLLDAIRGYVNEK